MLLAISLVGFAYLVGSLSTAIIVCKLLGLPDPRTQGSQNPGATNVLRFGGKKAAAVTLVGDMLKGLIPVLIASYWSASSILIASVALAAFLGHLYPVYFRFHGGKGVATALGVLLGIHWLIGLCTIISWLVMAAVFRISSLSALVSSALSPLFVYWVYPEPPLIGAALIMCALLFWRHRRNIQNLLAGNESKISK